ncbi:hypothetical protein ACRQKW_004745 [Citrobacter braakii]|uniref:Uncharacterized protein n=1 Tax=Salmonella enterica subsp. enterica serovar Heidelberg TaxID=611 RepID=A0A733CHG2_SALET|nr:hypothetical protein [Escherichia coli]EAN0446607.1 hypothetical protein [Salmonella enterica]EDT3787456.1 hypothetical protein [Salmonella enterica subsp. enterica serovar Thompson]HAE5578738.1 hypothetical protein [Salmonella enterica subsp. enterica serovar Heidelberg]EAY0627657.1 hypothetical protein [Salmonella enterica]EBC1407526.1 hypothetical protein [Salmonella enterica]
MKTNSFRKGNFTYYLNYDENEKRYSYVVYVKIRSSKRKAELKSTRVKDVDISFYHVDDPALKDLSNENIKMIKTLIMGIEK